MSVCFSDLGGSRLFSKFLPLNLFMQKETWFQILQIRHQRDFFSFVFIRTYQDLCAGGGEPPGTPWE